MEHYRLNTDKTATLFYFGMTKLQENQTFLNGLLFSVFRRSYVYDSIGNYKNLNAIISVPEVHTYYIHLSETINAKKTLKLRGLR